MSTPKRAVGRNRTGHSIATLLFCALGAFPIQAQEAQPASTRQAVDSDHEVMGQALLGAGLSVVGGIGLAFLGATTAGPCACEDPGLGQALVGFALGSTLGATLGVQIAGSRDRGRGSAAGTFLGSAIGLTSIVFLVSATSVPEELAVIGLFGLPTAGAIVGFHATRPRASGASAPPARRPDPDLHVTPIVRPDGSAGLSLTWNH